MYFSLDGSRVKLSDTNLKFKNKAPVAQWIEKQPSKLSVTGSNPVGRANLKGRDMARGAKVNVTCERCKQEFEARVADRKRGWARFCSKSCKAVNQMHTHGDTRKQVWATTGDDIPWDFDLNT